MTSTSFCPGHITALFYAPEPGPSPGATGSRGAGVCIAHGVRARVECSEGDVTRIVAGEDTRLSPVVTMAMGGYLLNSTSPFEARIDLEIELPVGQGFGMSGAMSLASLVAAEGELGLLDGDRDALVALAHAAEVEMGTGLGDVVAQARGGIDLRVREGLPPHGEVLTREHEGKLLVAWSDRPLHTRSVLSDANTRRRLREACGPRVEGLSEAPDMEWLLEEGWGFAQEAGLASEEVRGMVRLCSRGGRASQVMLGNSVFAEGDVALMEGLLEEEGFSTLVTSVDNGGARLLH
jgi:pantoate kinase